MDEAARNRTRMARRGVSSRWLGCETVWLRGSTSGGASLESFRQECKADELDVADLEV